MNHLTLGAKQADAASTALVRRLKDRDPRALAELYDVYCRIVFGLILRMVGDRGIAEDLTLETFLRVWNQVSMFDETRGVLGAWIVCVARNRADDYLRVKRFQDGREPEPGADRGIEKEITRRDRNPLLRPALEC